MKEFIDESNDNAIYGTTEYNGRTYILYGTLKSFIRASDINECIGYINQNENVLSINDENNKSRKIYTLMNIQKNNYLKEYDTETNLMNQLNFWRAVDA